MNQGQLEHETQSKALLIRVTAGSLPSSPKASLPGQQPHPHGNSGRSAPLTPRVPGPAGEQRGSPEALRGRESRRAGSDSCPWRKGGSGLPATWLPAGPGGRRGAGRESWREGKDPERAGRASPRARAAHIHPPRPMASGSPAARGPESAAFVPGVQSGLQPSTSAVNGVTGPRASSAALGGWTRVRAPDGIAGPAGGGPAQRGGSLYLPPAQEPQTLGSAPAGETAPSGAPGTGPHDQAAGPAQLHFPGSTAASARVGGRLRGTHYNSQNPPRPQRQKAGLRQLHFPSRRAVRGRLPVTNYNSQNLPRPQRQKRGGLNYNSQDPPRPQRCGRKAPVTYYNSQNTPRPQRPKRRASNNSPCPSTRASAHIARGKKGSR